MEILDGLLLVEVVQRWEVPGGHVGLLTSAQLSFGSSSSADGNGRDGNGELPDGHDLLLLRPGPGLGVGLVSLAPVGMNFATQQNDFFVSSPCYPLSSHWSFSFISEQTGFQ